MHRFTNILFSPLGDKDNAAAVRRVSELADQNGAKLTLLGVVAEPTGFQRALHRPHFFDDVQDDEIATMTKRLNRWASKTSEPPMETVTTLGSQALEIIDRAIVQRHDLVVVTTDEDHHDKATIQRLLRKCPCPVWVIRPTRAQVQRVLAAINPDPDEAELNRIILELASSMIERFGGELHLVHAWELYGEATMRSSAFIHTTPADLEQVSQAGASDSCPCHHRSPDRHRPSRRCVEDPPRQRTTRGCCSSGHYEVSNQSVGYGDACTHGNWWCADRKYRREDPR